MILSKKSEKGFTLIEVLVAMSILMIIATIFFKTINTSIISNHNNNKRIDTLNIAQTEIESIEQKIKDGDKLSSEKTWKKTSEIPLECRESECESDIHKKCEVAIIDDNNLDSYIREKDNYKYKVKLYLHRKMLGNKYLYTVKVDINLIDKDNDYASLSTKIYSN